MIKKLLLSIISFSFIIVLSSCSRVEAIECLTKGYESITDEEKLAYENEFDGFIFTTFKTGLKIELKFRVVPFNANRKLVFDYASSENYNITRTSSNSCDVEFFNPASFILTAKSFENENIQLKINIKAFKPEI